MNKTWKHGRGNMAPSPPEFESAGRRSGRFGSLVWIFFGHSAGGGTLTHWELYTIQRHANVLPVTQRRHSPAVSSSLRIIIYRACFANGAVASMVSVQMFSAWDLWLLQTMLPARRAITSPSIV